MSKMNDKDYAQIQMLKEHNQKILVTQIKNTKNAIDKIHTQEHNLGMRRRSLARKLALLQGKLK